MPTKYYEPHSIPCGKPKVSISPNSSRMRLNRQATLLWRKKTHYAKHLQLGYNSQTKKVCIKPANKGLCLVYCKGSQTGSSTISVEGFFRFMVKRYPKKPVQAVVKMMDGLMIFSLKGIV